MIKTRRSIFTRLPGWKFSRASRIAWIFILVVLLIAIIGPFIANEKPYYVKLDGIAYSPVLSGVSESTLSLNHPQHSPVNWYTTQFETILYAPIPYSYYTIDLSSGALASPFENSPHRHWLGTDMAGRDVMAGMIRGCRVSLLIGLGSMLLALLIGIPLGSLAAYFGNKEWRASWFQIVIALLLISGLIYVVWLPIPYLWKTILILFIVVMGILTTYFSGKSNFKKVSLPLDQLVMSLISIIDSFPGLFIILILLVIVPIKGWLIVMGAIALLRWPVMARYMRAEVYKMKESNYIKAAQVLNIPHLRILSHHIIPYAFRPVMISFIFGVSSAILAESSLSFLGIGLPAEELNWGRLLSQARNHFEAWWLVLFPGAAIFFTLLSLYTIGNAARNNLEKLD